MGILEVLTVVLKLCGVISWPWLLVILPEIIAAGIYIIWILGVIGLSVFHAIFD